MATHKLTSRFYRDRVRPIDDPSHVHGSGYIYILAGGVVCLHLSIYIYYNFVVDPSGLRGAYHAHIVPIPGSAT